jgi:hypothetical protein
MNKGDTIRLTDEALARYCGIALKDKTATIDSVSISKGTIDGKPVECQEFRIVFDHDLGSRYIVSPNDCQPA